MPFIIRGVSLLGVASAGTARDIREAVWQHLAGDWKPAHLERICTREVGLDAACPRCSRPCSPAARSAARWSRS